MKSFRPFLFVIVAILPVCLIRNVKAQVKPAKSGIKYSRAALVTKAAVEADPENLEAHHAFLYSSGTSPVNLLKQYQLWMKRFPGSPTVFFALGEYYHLYEEPLKGQPYLAMAVKLNPKLAQAWKMLAETATSYDYDRAHAYALRAAVLEPENPDYAYTYAYTFKNTDSLKYDSLMQSVAGRFRGTNQRISALYELIKHTRLADQRDIYYNTILSNPPAKLSALYNGLMMMYYRFLLLKDKQKAMDLALKMSLDKKNAMGLGDWRDRYLLAHNLMAATEMMAAGKTDSAGVILDSLKYNTSDQAVYTSIALLKAKAADAANHTKLAYSGLIKIYSTMPDDSIRAAMIYYGAKLGHGEKEVMDNIWQMRDSASNLATGFRLKSFLTNDSVSLADYRGKVILLTYWFPGCGPCRAEFPYFEAAINKINSADLIYLGLNLEPIQDKEVMPLVKLNKYSFIPLQDSWKRKKGNIPAPMAPANYLIDQGGRIMFSNFDIDEDNVRTLELMITELLNRQKLKEGLGGDSVLVDSGVFKKHN